MCHLSHDAPVLRKIHPFAIRPSPTHFLSLQTAGLAPAIEKVQAALVAHTPALAPALVDAATMHLTLMVCGSLAHEPAVGLYMPEAASPARLLHACM